MGRLSDQPGFRKFWIADSVSMFGSFVTAVALPALAILTMNATDIEVGVLRAAQWLPYLLFGLLAGVVVDRYPRKPILIGTDLARAVVLGLIPVLSLAGLLSVPLLAGIVAVFGVMSLVYDAAHQSFFPRLVPPDLLTSAHARFGQTRSLAESTGPILGGGLVAAVGAQLAILVDAFSYLISAVLLIGVRSTEPVAAPGKRHLLNELREGVRWVYRHPMLGPMALTNHLRFGIAGMTSTILLLFFVHGISAGLSEKEIGLGLGLVVGLGGLGGVIGAGLAGRVGLRFGVGRTIVAMRAFEPVALVLLAIAPTGYAGWAMAGASQFLAFTAFGVWGPNEMGYRQAVTPDRLQARMNATIRSFNWGTVAIGAPLGGVLAQLVGYRQALWIGIAGIAISALLLGLSNFRHARHGDAQLAVATSG